MLKSNNIEKLINNNLISVEVKATKTVSDSFFKELLTWLKISKQEDQRGYVVFSGNQSFERKEGTILEGY